MQNASKVVYLKPRWHAMMVLASLMVFIGTAIAAGGQQLSSAESFVFETIYGLPDGLAPLFLTITQLGSGWMVLVLALVAVTDKIRGLAFKVVVNGAATFIAVEYAKIMIARPRPFVLQDSVESREPLVAGYGFPSGHTAMTTVLGFTLLPYLPRRFRPIVPVLVVLVGLSRIYLGVHAPLDIIGGLAIGLVIASFQHTWSSRRQSKKHRSKA